MSYVLRTLSYGQCANLSPLEEAPNGLCLRSAQRHYTVSALQAKSTQAPEPAANTEWLYNRTLANSGSVLAECFVQLLQAEAVSPFRIPRGLLGPCSQALTLNAVDLASCSFCFDAVYEPRSKLLRKSLVGL